MPTTGINFSPIKSRKTTISSNPRSASTARWEKALEGLTLSKHRADRAAATARSRVRNKAKKYPGWDALTREEQEARLKIEYDKIAKACLDKKAALGKAWRNEHGVRGSESAMDRDSGDVEQKAAVTVSECLPDYEEDQGMSEEEAGEDVSHDEMAEEDNEPDSTGPFTEADKQSILSRMEIVQKNHERRAARLLSDWEQATEDVSSEMPADWTFGK